LKNKAFSNFLYTHHDLLTVEIIISSADMGLQLHNDYVTYVIYRIIQLIHTFRKLDSIRNMWVHSTCVRNVFLVYLIKRGICLDILPLQTRRQTLGQFLCLLSILYNQSVHESRASDLEFGLVGTLADLDKLCVSTTCLLEEITDISNLLWHL
jgi:hypothetical protein